MIADRCHQTKNSPTEVAALLALYQCMHIVSLLMVNIIFSGFELFLPEEKRVMMVPRSN